MSTSRGLTIPRYFTKSGDDVLSLIDWRFADLEIKNKKKETIFKQDHVEIPAWWTDSDARICVSKYFCGQQGTPERETSAKQLFTRVVKTITQWGILGGYFADAQTVNTFYDELLFMVITGRYAFNSPVWFNLGNPNSKPQASACFVNSVNDTMESILDLGFREGMQFKYGSGAGVNVSPIRSKREKMTGGGRPSGPISFMRGWDKMAGAIESGGRTRRAAKLICMDVSHPDIREFINHKWDEEKKAKILIAAGYSADIDGEALATVDGQNANNSIRANDAFMYTVLVQTPNGTQDKGPAAGYWNLTARTTGETIETVVAAEIFDLACERAHGAGCPGIQFDDTINKYNKVPSLGRKNTTNPCAEFDNVDDTSCNLGSHNLRRYQRPAGGFLVEDFMHAVMISAVAQEILVGDATGKLFVQCSQECKDHSAAHAFDDDHLDSCPLTKPTPYGAVYPTPLITSRTQATRPIGIGLTNLGAYLMVAGLPYDSDPARVLSAAIVGLMSGVAWETSAKIARNCGGAFPVYQENKEAMRGCIVDYAAKAYTLCKAVEPVQILPWLTNPDQTPDLDPALRSALIATWNEALYLGDRYGYRNNEVTSIAPTGTISFLMAARTTSGEPAMGLITYKDLVGGGTEILIVGEVEQALGNLGYSIENQNAIRDWITTHGTVQGCSVLYTQHEAVFDCALKSKDPLATRTISTEGHVRMLAALQMLTSMAVSKTVNLPPDATIADFRATYLLAWRLGCKSVAAYRDESKAAQPVNMGPSKSGPVPDSAQDQDQDLDPAQLRGYRRELPNPRAQIAYKFTLGGIDGYFQVGIYPDTGEIGEVFISTYTEGSTLNGMLSAFSIAVSYGLQYGVPLQKYFDKFHAMSFPPSGFTGDEMQSASSIPSYIFRWINDQYPAQAPKAIRAVSEILSPSDRSDQDPILAVEQILPKYHNPVVADASAPVCSACGNLMIRNVGTCYKCPHCGNTLGGCGAG